MRDGNTLDPPLAFGREVGEMEIIRYAIRHAANRMSARRDLIEILVDASRAMLVRLGALPAPDGEPPTPAARSEALEENDEV
jgi:hypothetical protein